jgi:saccharopine dehydrogenase-like NADP-dependent oxidoreductase
LLTGYAAHQLDHISKVDIYVGGLPKLRTKPWEYKAVFSPTDVIEEYTRPARLVEHKKIVTKPALTEIELLEFENVGTLEAFNSDGLRSLMFTIEADMMREKTLRYPGYAEKIKLLADNGFFKEDAVDIGGQKVSPLELTSKLLFSQWKLNDGEVDVTVMRITVEGKKNGDTLRYQFDLYDEYDLESKIHSMARTTGYTATMAVRLLEKGLYSTTGITVPEFLGKDQKVVNFMLDGLKKRGVVYKSSMNKIS